MLRWKRILVATDFSPPADVALRSAESLAREARGTLVLPSFAVTTGAVFAADAIFRGEVTTADEVRAYVETNVRATIRDLARLSSALRISVRDGGSSASARLLGGVIPGARPMFTLPPCATVSRSARSSSIV